MRLAGGGQAHDADGAIEVADRGCDDRFVLDRVEAARGVGCRTHRAPQVAGTVREEGAEGAEVAGGGGGGGEIFELGARAHRAACAWAASARA